MNRVGLRRLRRVDDRGDVQVAVARGRRTDSNRAIRFSDVRCLRVRIGINGHGLDVELSTRANDAARDLAAIRYQQSLDHGLTVQRGCRFSRNAFKPSWPSGATRCEAIASAVIPTTSEGCLPRTCGINPFARATAVGAADSGSVT